MRRRDGRIYVPEWAPFNGMTWRLPFGNRSAVSDERALEEEKCNTVREENVTRSRDSNFLLRCRDIALIFNAFVESETDLKSRN